MKLALSGEILGEKKSSDIKFHENLSSGGPSCSMRTDRQDEANDRFTPVFPNRLKMLLSFCKG
jgi:hypothetical protein